MKRKYQFSTLQEYEILFFFFSRALSNGLAHTTEESLEDDISVNKSTNDTWTLCAVFEEAAPLKVLEILLAAPDRPRTLFYNDP